MLCLSTCLKVFINQEFILYKHTYITYIYIYILTTVHCSGFINKRTTSNMRLTWLPLHVYTQVLFCICPMAEHSLLGGELAFVHSQLFICIKRFTFYCNIFIYIPFRPIKSIIIFLPSNCMAISFNFSTLFSSYTFWSGNSWSIYFFIMPLFPKVAMPCSQSYTFLTTSLFWLFHPL